MPDSRLPGVTLTEDQQNELLKLKKQVLQECLIEYEQLLRRTLDFSQWRFLKDLGALTAYQRRKHVDNGANSSKLPSLLLVGSVDGTLHDMLYGALSTTRAERMLRSAYTQDGVQDATVLCTLEKPSQKNPFRSTTLQWSLKKNPAANMLVKDRDYCFLAATGMVRTPWHERIGFELCHSVDLAPCPKFDGKSIVRGKLFVCTFFRETEAEPGVVEIFSKASYDPNGDWLASWACRSTAETLLKSTSRIVQCSYSKKLWRAIEQNACSCVMSGEANLLKTFVKAASYCMLCQKRVSTKHTGSSNGSGSNRQCALCDKWVCSDCVYRTTVVMAAQEELLQQSRSDLLGFLQRKKKFDFCVRCFVDVVAKDAAEIAWEEARQREQHDRVDHDDDLLSSFSTSSSWSVLGKTSSSLRRSTSSLSLSDLDFVDLD